MPIATNPTLHHVRVTVSDLDRSLGFYTDVLGFEIAARSQGDPRDPAVRNDPNQLFGGAVLHANGTLFGLRPTADPADHFDCQRVGLDHISFKVSGRAELERIARELHDRGIEHGELIDLPAFGLTILSFEDPDGIHLEFCADLTG